MTFHLIWSAVIAQSLADLNTKRWVFNPQFWCANRRSLCGQTTCSNLMGIVDWAGVIIHESQDLAFVRQHDLLVNTLTECMSPMRSVNCLDYR